MRKTAVLTALLAGALPAAAGTTATLRFTGLDATNINGSVTLDAIQIVGVIPAPAAASLLGLAGLAGLRRRR